MSKTWIVVGPTLAAWAIAVLLFIEMNRLETQHPGGMAGLVHFMWAVGLGIGGTIWLVVAGLIAIAIGSKRPEVSASTPTQGSSAQQENEDK